MFWHMWSAYPAMPRPEHMSNHDGARRILIDIGLHDKRCRPAAGFLYLLSPHCRVATCPQVCNPHSESPDKCLFFILIKEMRKIH